MHFRQRVLLAGEKQAKRYDKKYDKWRKGQPRHKHYQKPIKTQSKRRVKKKA
jgi:hypothetical protein